MLSILTISDRDEITITAATLKNKNIEIWRRLVFLFWERVWGVFGCGRPERNLERHTCCDQDATVHDTDESNVTEMAHKFMKISELIKAERKANEKILKKTRRFHTWDEEDAPRLNRGFLVSQRRTWGVAAVRAAARLRASRAVFIGMEPRVAQGLRRVAHRGAARWTQRCSWLALHRLLTIAAAERLWGRWVPWVPGASAVPCRLSFRL